MAAIAESAESPDGLVAATVGECGELRSLWLDPRVYRNRDAAELAGDIQQTVRSAAALARRRAYEILEPDLPPGATVEDADLVFDPLLTAIDKITGTRTAAPPSCWRRA
ncbi:hypothetical protein GCM10009765_68340 [Fodinicola feengrottensis]|uniref:Uncharacterized protein n=1 Tax=Fodinicola feengrottensis TaxID=435914 RepID=A0ABN2IPQ2_9ACTN